MHGSSAPVLVTAVGALDPNKPEYAIPVKLGTPLQNKSLNNCQFALAIDK